MIKVVGGAGKGRGDGGWTLAGPARKEKVGWAGLGGRGARATDRDRAQTCITQTVRWRINEPLQSSNRCHKHEN